MSESETEPEPNATLEFTFRDSESTEKVLRSVVLGYQPIVVIEPELDDDGSATINIDSTDFTPDELVYLFEGIARALRNATS